jgi:hypothetical protein
MKGQGRFKGAGSLLLLQAALLEERLPLPIFKCVSYATDARNKAIDLWTSRDMRLCLLSIVVCPTRCCEYVLWWLGHPLYLPSDADLQANKGNEATLQCSRILCSIQAEPHLLTAGV